VSIFPSAAATAVSLFVLVPRNALAQQKPATTNQPVASDYEAVLHQADEDDKETYLESHAAFRYRHDQFPDSLNGDELRIHWQQSFASSGRLAAGIELPFINVRGDGSRSTGTGDIQLDFRGMMGKYERFEHAAGIQVVLPSASHELLEDGQTVLGLVWGFSAAMTKHTTLDAEFKYRKAVSSRFDTPERNNLGAEVILTHAFTERVGGYLASESYYEFSVYGYVNTLKIGAAVLLDRQKKWSFSPYVLFPLTHAARHLETDGAAGLDLTFEY